MDRVWTALVSGVLVLGCGTMADAVEIVARLECAPANDLEEAGGFGSRNHCKTVYNGCGDPIELHVVDNVTHTRQGTGMIDPRTSGKVCTSNTNAVHHYTIYGKRTRQTQSSWDGLTFSVGGVVCDTVGNGCKTSAHWEIDVRGDAITARSAGPTLVYVLNGTSGQALGGGGQATLTSTVSGNVLRLSDTARYPQSLNTVNTSSFSITRTSASSCSFSWSAAISDDYMGKHRAWKQYLTNPTCQVTGGR